MTDSIKDSVYEKVMGFHDYNWYLTLTVPAQTTITALIIVPKDEVYIETGYEFEPDALTYTSGGVQYPIWTFSHWHDGRPQMLNVALTESWLSFRYTKKEIVEETFTITITNNDTVDHTITTIGLYRSIPRAIYNKIKEGLIKGE